MFVTTVGTLLHNSTDEADQRRLIRRQIRHWIVTVLIETGTGERGDSETDGGRRKIKLKQGESNRAMQIARLRTKKARDSGSFLFVDNICLQSLTDNNCHALDTLRQIY